MASSKFGRLCEKSTSLFLCDMQEKFRHNIGSSGGGTYSSDNYSVYFPQIVEVARRMNEFGKIMNFPTVVTEQYPKGLGPTVSELGDISHSKKYEKTCFSMVLPEVEKELIANDIKSVVLCGLETQACILKTTIDLLDKNYDVHVVADAVSSRSQVDRLFALATMRQMGAFVTTSETVLLQLLGDSKHPKFREAQTLIMTSAPDSGLAQAFSGSF